MKAKVKKCKGSVNDEEVPILLDTGAETIYVSDKLKNIEGETAKSISV